MGIQNIPTNIGVCTISIEVLHKLLRLPDEIKIIILRQDARDYTNNTFRIVLQDEAFSIMETPLNDDGTRAKAPVVQPIYKADDDEPARWSGWRQLTNNNLLDSDVEDWCQW